MTTYVRQTEMQGLEINIGRDAALVRIPRVESAMDYFLLEEDLASEVRRRPATNWILDLSEHTEGVTLMLAGVLAGLGETARRLGCTVQCVGIRKTCTACESLCGATTFPGARATVKTDRGGLGITEEPSYLQW
jgi:hypothetical protein